MEKPLACRGGPGRPVRPGWLGFAGPDSMKSQRTPCAVLLLALQEVDPMVVHDSLLARASVDLHELLETEAQLLIPLLGILVAAMLLLRTPPIV